MTVVLCQNIADKGTVPTVLRQLVGCRIIDEQALSLCANPDATVPTAYNVLHSGTDAHAILSLLVEAFEAVGLPVVDVEPERPAKPNVVAVFIERSNGIVLNTALSLNHITVDGVLRSVEAVQAVVRAYPYEAVSVAQTAERIVVTQAVGCHIVGKGHWLSPAGGYAGKHPYI